MTRSTTVRRRNTRALIVALPLSVTLTLAWPNLGCPPVDEEPEITSITPDGRGVGETLDIAGTAFGTTAASTTGTTCTASI